ncbi:hypothetical protein PLICRDRAFT_179226 [Plicaturopsis crispa FD-325 SS-3]|uniref:Zn(2)-C6 fungal-type domain-containing protein n=1 Tax=Plicaturopsis crispa FD-325 SS-3 TaxID=944288 RepID=A0A0C9T6D4_PLICR|nr:hypothetical protein PLICRDRAFT_179226 [Plicaturopsis crispa FD-325 SS-3]
MNPVPSSFYDPEQDYVLQPQVPHYEQRLQNYHLFQQQQRPTTHQQHPHPFQPQHPHAQQLPNQYSFAPEAYPPPPYLADSMSQGGSLHGALGGYVPGGAGNSPGTTSSGDVYIAGTGTTSNPSPPVAPPQAGFTFAHHPLPLPARSEPTSSPGEYPEAPKRARKVTETTRKRRKGNESARARKKGKGKPATEGPGYLDSESGEEEEEEEAYGEPPKGAVPTRLPGACTNCKRQKMKCEFHENQNQCQRCRASNHPCIVEGRKPRNAPK